MGDGIFFNTIKNDPNIDHFETHFFFDTWNERKRRITYRNKYKKQDLVFLLDNGTLDWWQAKKNNMDIYAEKCGVTLEQRRPISTLHRYDIH